MSAAGSAPNKDHKKSPDVHKKSPDAHLVLQVLICILCLIIPVLVGWWYSYNEIEGSLSVWITILFCIPPLLQILGLWALYRKLKYERKVWKFYWYSLFWMFPLIISYTILWGIYAAYGSKRPGLLACAAPTLLVLFFLIPVAGMTYTIMQGSESGEDAGDEERGKFWHTAKHLWRHCILLKDMKESVVQVPYWALLFFFSFFLGISFLFGFAFAFHDKREFPESGKNGVPALYKEKKYSPDPKERQQLQSPGSFTSDSQTTPASNYAFYFDPDSAYMLDNNSKVPKGEKSQESWDLRKTKNEEQMEELISCIIQTTQKGERIRILLRGQTENNDLRFKQHPSKHVLSETRASNMRAAILSQLSKKDMELSKVSLWRDIDWQYQTMSNEMPPETTESPSFKEQLEFKQKSLPFLSILGPNKIPAPEIDSTAQTLSAKIDEIKDSGKKLLPSERESLIKKVNACIALIQSHDDAQSRKQEINKIIDTIKRDFKGCDLIDSNEKRRIVAVSVTPLYVQPNIDYTKLSLIDYVYFIGYTITTTGYGDIVPISSYAKFLCTAANIIEVFFLVVFFNALLSIKKSKEKKSKDLISPTHKTYEAGLDTDIVTVTVPSHLHWVSETNDNWISILEGHSGEGNGLVKFLINQNEMKDSRDGSITIAGQKFVIYQKAPNQNHQK